MYTECPYEGQVFMDCTPLCPTTCSNKDVASPCPRVCVRGCGCLEGMVIDEEQRRCVMPSQCPNKSKIQYHNKLVSYVIVIVIPYNLYYRILEKPPLMHKDEYLEM